MFNIPRYQRYNGETKIALMDNSTIAFMEQMERLGISAKEVLRGYNKILIPNWVLEEVQDSVYREQYIENLVTEAGPSDPSQGWRHRRCQCRIADRKAVADEQWSGLLRVWLSIYVTPDAAQSGE